MNLVDDEDDHPTEIKKMPVKEFRELGYLQELNRRFLHPLGLALEVEIFPSGDERFGGIWDYRDDPEGCAFDPEVTDNKQAIQNAMRIYHEMAVKGEARVGLFGHVIQPLGEEKADGEVPGPTGR